MGALQKASEDIQSLASKFAGIVDLAAALSKIESVDQMLLESPLRVQAAKDAEAAALAAHDEAELLVGKAKAELQKVETAINSVIDAAHEEYDKIVGEAHADAAKLVDEAKATGAAVEEHYTKIKQEARDAEAKVFQKIEEHTHWHEKVEALKAQVRSLLE